MHIKVLKCSQNNVLPETHYCIVRLLQLSRFMLESQVRSCSHVHSVHSYCKAISAPKAMMSYLQSQQSHNYTGITQAIAELYLKVNILQLSKGKCKYNISK